MHPLIRRVLPLPVLLLNGDLLPWLLRRAGDNHDTALLHLIFALGLGGWWLSHRSVKIWNPLPARLSLPLYALCALLALSGALPLVRMFALCLALAATLLIQLPRPARHAPSLTAACLLLPFSEDTASFLLGYPARVLATRGAALLLRLSGFHIRLEGAVLIVNNTPLFADAPCAGLMMGWTGLAIAALLALYQNLTPRKTLRLLAATALLILAGNALRMAALAQLETLKPGASQNLLLHNTIGIASFIILLPLLLRLSPFTPLPALKITHPHSAKPALWLPALLLALAAPLLRLPASTSAPPPTQPAPPDWPAAFENESLTPIPPLEIDQRFASNFPGQMARFRGTGGSQILFRRTDRATRQLHPSLHCYRAAGYRIHPLPARRDAAQTLWTRYQVEKNGKIQIIEEQIRSLSTGQTWPDVSAWYWQALTRQDPGPWLAITRASLPAPPSPVF